MMLQQIRSRAGKVFVLAIIPAFIGWMVLEMGMEILGGGMGRAGEAGRVNGTPISAEAYNTRYNLLYQQASQRGSVNSELARRLQDEAWEQMVNDVLIRQELERRGITVTDREILWAARNLPHPQLMQEEIFLTQGVFDIDRYRQFLATSADATLFAELEAYYRDWLPREKLLRQLSAGRYVTDAELWRAYRDREETVTVDYLTMNLSRIAEPAVSDAEVRRYYQENRDRFRRPEGARFRMAYVPLTITEADREATIDRARSIREEIAAGEDFAAIARRESADPGSRDAGGDLGTFGRGQMVAPFDSAVFSLPLGEVSEPVVTQFGAHLIEVLSRDGDEASARHILLRFEKGDEELARIQETMNELRAGALRDGLEQAAARHPEVIFRDDVEITSSAAAVAGIGSAMDALNWAQDEQAARGTGDGTGISDVLDTDDAFYVAELVDYHEAGVAPLEAVAPSIRMIVAQQKRLDAARVQAEALLAEIRQGRSLEEVAAAHEMTVYQAGPFSRVDPHPVLGQANAATGAAFGTPIGEVGPVAVTVSGVFIIRPSERTEADRRDWERQKTEQRQQAMMALQQELYMQWLADVREGARIRDNRLRQS